MKLTKRQRLQAYKYALRELEKNKRTEFVCILLEEYIEKITGNFPSHPVILFPEFLYLKPKSEEQYGCWWAFKSKAPRIKALKKAIIAASPVKKK